MAISGLTLETKGQVPLIDREAPAEVQTATFALGWFWGPDSRFGSIPGVVRTRVGYSGGSKENPTYRSLGDHAETIEIDFDPEQITYGQLLEVFFGAHSPMSRSWSRQYMSAIFYHDEEQRRLALEAKQRYSQQEGSKVYTELLPFEAFYLAEDYHQKHALQRYPDFFSEIRAVYPTVQGLVDSTAVARLNGYLGGYGHYDDLVAEIDGYGLAPEARDRLLEIVQNKGW